MQGLNIVLNFEDIFSYALTDILREEEMTKKKTQLYTVTHAIIYYFDYVISFNEIEIYPLPHAHHHHYLQLRQIIHAINLLISIDVRNYK